MSVVRILKHGQVTIPKKFRETLGLERGDLVEAELHGDQVVITPKKRVKENPFLELKALLQRVHARNQGFTEEEVAADVQRAIAELREEDNTIPDQGENGD